MKFCLHIVLFKGDERHNVYIISLLNSFPGKLVGVNITDGVVSHFQKYHVESMCDVLGELSTGWEMLSESSKHQ